MSATSAKAPKGAAARINDFFCSIKLSIVVLISLAITSIFGTVIQQEKGEGVYIQEYGETVARVINAFSLDDMYHSWWFQLLLVLLLLNITFCSIRRLPQAIRQMKDREPVFDGRPVALHERWEKRFGLAPGEAASRAETLFHEHFGKVHKAEREGVLYLMGSKGGWSRMGVYITHFSLFLFALGALIGGWYGYKGYVQINEGDTVSEVALRGGGTMPLGFQLRCDDFDLEFYNDPSGRPTGRPKDYKSTLTVIEGGKELYSKTIEVNDPLIHQGIFFYQSSYGQGGGRGATLSVFGPKRNLLFHRKRLPLGGRAELENGDEIMLRNVAGDFRNMGPAAEVVLIRQGKQGESTVVFEAQRFNQRPLGGYTVRLEEVETVMYTGLQVAKDPGVPVVWAGCILITIGCLVAFFVSHRRVWIRVTPEPKGVRLLLAGNASRNRISFERWFEDLCETAQETFEK